MSDLDISRLQQRAYRRALRDAVEAVKALDTWSDDHGANVFVWQKDAVAAIEALGETK